MKKRLLTTIQLLPPVFSLLLLSGLNSFLLEIVPRTFVLRYDSLVRDYLLLDNLFFYAVWELPPLYL